MAEWGEMKKDWTGNSKSIYSTLGASSHSEEDRQVNDYYATPLKATEMLLELESFKNVLEPACGEGHISEVLKQHHISVVSSDLIDRKYGKVKNFFDYNNWNGDIVTNPPYKYAKEFVGHSLSIIPENNKIAMFLKIQFLEGKARKKMFLKHPPKKVYISSSRLTCAKNGIWGEGTSAVAFCWFIWEKGFNGKPVIDWFN